MRHRENAAPQEPAAPPPPVPVVTATVKQEDVPIILKGIGTVQALNRAAIRSQVTGYLESVAFTEGQSVRRGDVLARIDPRIYQARLGTAQAQLGRDQALLTNRQTNLQRNEPLLQRGYATEQSVTGEKAQIAQSENAVKGDQAAIDYARTELDFATLRAPFDGVTGIRLIDIGNVVQPSDPGGVVVLTQVQPISVIFTLPTDEIPQVQAALGRGPVPTTVYDQAGTRKLDTGSLLLIDNEAQPKSGTVRLKANFPNAERQLWPGAFANVEITTSIVKGALTIPTDAVQQNDKGPFVFVVGDDHTVSIRPVQVGQRVRGVALIAEGVKAGETVVVQGQYNLVPGKAVVAASPDQVSDTTTASAGMLP
ncbi:efflux RND transporter periplasmic adaptor subunit [Methylobacterium nonmethylotrophicum]|uniref:Efflux RND transporter periplasmic adaptor subunit n=2 Tax=Methylobacterium nonmethylotrophicum TaxID=1141884 RepID=A0A4Z0NEC5_9HYPH|nr:efflux RND transporter periplasmic adaptor subunit [Methylobacterium nonmethylotrophicum]